MIAIIINNIRSHLLSFILFPQKRPWDEVPCRNFVRKVKLDEQWVMDKFDIRLWNVDSWLDVWGE